jgi:CubicO group peptidase (beta-lactamase class C family)
MQKAFYISIFLLLCGGRALQAQSLYYPPLIGTAWDTVASASLGWCPQKTEELIEYVGQRNTKAFIVLKDGKIVLEKYYDGFARESLWYWASAGKTLTAFAVGLAQQEGYLSIEDPTSDYLGEGWTSLPADKEALITIRNQLSMTTGLDDAVSDNTCTLPSCLTYQSDAGDRWAYHNAPYTLLDEMLEAATGQTLNAYLAQKVHTKTGMTGGFVSVDNNKVYLSNARSMARFGLLILGKGRWNETVVMSDEDYFDAMTTPSQTLNKAYGYLWWLNGQASFMVPGLQLVFPGTFNPNAPADMIAALGKNGQFLNIVPSQNLVFVRLGNAPGNDDVPFLLNDTIWQKLNHAMEGCVPASVHNFDKEKNIQVFPNPVQHTMYLEGIDETKPYTVSIFSIQGRLLYTFSQENSIELSALPAGMYSVAIRQEEVVYHRKFSKY